MLTKRKQRKQQGVDTMLDNTINLNSFRSKTDKFFKQLEDASEGRNDWWSLDTDDRLNLMASYSEIDSDACADALIKSPYIKEVACELVRFMRNISFMDLSGMDENSADKLEIIQESLKMIFDNHLGNIIDKKIPYSLDYHDRVSKVEDRILKQVNDLGRLL